MCGGVRGHDDQHRGHPVQRGDPNLDGHEVQPDVHDARARHSRRLIWLYRGRVKTTEKSTNN